jgi:hypothetical protein
MNVLIFLNKKLASNFTHEFNNNGAKISNKFIFW